MLPNAEVNREVQPASYVDLIALARVGLESTLSANTRAQIRRSARRYEEQLGQLQMHRAKDVDEALVLLDELAILLNARRRAKGEQGSFESPAVMQFHRQLIAKLHASREVDLLRLDAGTTPVGYLYNFLQRGKVYFFQSGFRYETDAKMKPGLLTHVAAIQKYCAEGLLEYDFLAGDSQYKRSLSKEARNLHWTVVFRDGPRMKAMLALRGMVQRLRTLKRGLRDNRT
jgi:CelD/BcsL family acetyltransferase involved in cellulose biosynthesis